MEINDEWLAETRRIAELTKPSDRAWNRDPDYGVLLPGGIYPVQVCSMRDGHNENWGEHIARMNPEATLALLDLVDRLSSTMEERVLENFPEELVAKMEAGFAAALQQMADEMQEVVCERDEARAEVERSQTSSAVQRKLRLEAVQRARDFEEMFNDAVRDLAKLREQTRWIPVEERLPEAWHYVLVSNGRGRYIAQYQGAHGWLADDNETELLTVTHWMSLPELRRGE